MAFLSEAVRDSGLTILDALSVPEILICSSEPTTRAEAITAKLGTKTTPTIGAPEAGTTGQGRKVVTSAITDGSVTATGTATHWAMIDDTVLHASTTLSSSQAVTSGNTFTLDAFEIEIPDA